MTGTTNALCAEITPAPQTGCSHTDFTALAREFMPDLYRYALWLSHDKSRAEDLVQECLLRAWRSFASLRTPGAAKYWLLTILRREHARYFARQKLKTVPFDGLARHEEPVVFDKEIDITELPKWILKLDHNYREPITLQVLMGYTSAEIAKILGIKANTVLTRLHRGRQKLSKMINA